MYDRDRMLDGMADAGMVDLWVVLHPWHDDVTEGEVVTYERLLRIRCIRSLSDVPALIARGVLRPLTLWEWRAWYEREK